MRHGKITVTIDLDTAPQQGRVQLVTRLTTEDKNDVDRATLACDMNQTQFTRLAIVLVARAVLEKKANPLRNVELTDESTQEGAATTLDPYRPPGVES